MNFTDNTQARSTRVGAAAIVADIVCILVFCAAGRRSHDEGLTAAGLAHTAWPFLAGAGVGWLAARGWRAPTSLRPTGLIVWIATVVGGMVLRKLTGAGVAVSFVVVATSVTAVLLLGWRALWQRVSRAR